MRRKPHVPRPTVRTVLPRARPMGARLPQLTASVAREAPAMLAIASKAAPTLVSGGQNLGSPWMRAIMLTPSVSQFMTMTWQGGSDPRWLAELMDKPSQALAMTFGADPQDGLVTGRFTGSAVVFLATAQFAPVHTVALR